VTRRYCYKRQFKEGPHCHECYATVNLTRRTCWLAAPDNTRFGFSLQHMKGLTADDLARLEVVIVQALAVLNGAPSSVTMEECDKETPDA